MLRRTLLLAAAAPGAALAQANLRPDPTPRIPPQPGQGRPAEDVRWLRDAGALSAAQAEAAAALPGGEEEERRFAAALAERHRALARDIAGFAGEPAPDAAAGGRPDAPASAPRVVEAVARLRAARGAPPRDFLAAQLAAHPVLVEMYQTQASNTPDRAMGRWAIIALDGIQRDFAEAARLGQRHGLQAPANLLANPPQYGPGAGPPR